MPNLARIFRTVLALAPAVILSVAVAVAGLYVVRRLIPPESLRESNDVAGNYLQTLGTIYAVLLAFVVIIVWQQFNDARAYVECEATQLLDLFRTSKGFSPPARSELQSYLLCYVDAVLDEEWAAMARNERVVFERVWSLFDQVADAVYRCTPEGERDKLLYSEALTCLNDLSDVRTNRLSASRLRIPIALRILLNIGAAILVGSMYLFAVESFLIHAIMTGAIAGAVAHVLYVIEDLDNAFAGDWHVPRAPFERVREYMRRAAARSADVPV